MSTYRVGDYVRALIDQETGEIVGFRTPADEDQILALSSVTSAAVTTALGYTPENPINKGIGNGYASLDGTGRVPASQLPLLGTFLGGWNATTNSPALAGGDGIAAGSYRVVTTAGTQNIGEGSTSFSVGNYVIYDGSTAWVRVALSTAGVASATTLDAIADFDATDVQAAIEELIDEKAEQVAPTFLDVAGGAIVMRITAAGNVGVGSSIPSGLYGKFGVLGTGAQSTYVQSLDAGGVIVQTTADTDVAGEIGTVSDHPLVIKTNDTVALTIDEDQIATFEQLTITTASTTTRAGLRVKPGVAPTSPVNGDVWGTADGLFARVAGATRAVGHFAQGGSGAVVRPAEDKDRETVSITDFAADGVSGAKVDPTGVLDSTAGIQAALDYVSASGGEVRAPRGTYKVSSAIVIPAGVRLLGEGQRATYFNLPASGYDGFTLAGSSSEMHDLCITAPAARTSGAHIQIPAYRSQKVHRCLFLNAYRGIRCADGVTITSIVDCEFINTTPTTGVCIEVQGGNDTFIVRCVADNPAGAGNEPEAGIKITKTGAVWMTDNDFIHCNNGLAVVPDGAGVEVTWCFGVNNAFDSSTIGTGVYIRPTNGAKVRSFQQIGLWSATNVIGMSVDTDGAAGSSIDGVYLDSPRFYNNGQQGFFHGGGADVTNISLNNPQITGNSRSSPGTYSGIYIGPNSAAFYITGGKSGAHAGFTASQFYGIQIDTGCSNYTVQGIAVDNNASGGIANSSAAAALGRMKDNPGSTTRSTGIATIPSGATVVTVTHGMAFTPTLVQVSPYITNLGGISYWVDTPNATDFKIYLSTAHGSNALFCFDAQFI